MPVKQKTYFKPLPTGSDRISINIKLRNGKVMYFSVQYETFINNQWTKVRRYDSTHGIPHVHIFHSVENEHKRSFPCVDLSSGLTEAVRMLTESFGMFKHNYLTQRTRGEL
jgi:hypothetical protein